MLHFIKTTLLAGALGWVATSSIAAPLTLGGSTFVTGTTFAAQPELGGTVINDDILTRPALRIPDPSSIFFVNFDIQNRVVESDVDGTMIFGPRIRFGANVTGGNFFIDSLELFGYGDFATDVAYRVDGLGDAGPTSAERSADGERLSFDFGFPLVVGNLVASVKQESHFLSIKTDATAFNTSGTATIYGRHIDYPGQTFRLDYAGLAVPTAGPAIPPVPVPASMLFMLSGLGAFFGVRRKFGGATPA